MTDDPTPPPAPRHTPTWSKPSGPPSGPPVGQPVGQPVGPGPQGWYAPAAPAAPKKRHPALTHTAVALVALFIGVGIGQSGGSSGEGKEAAAAATTSPATTTPAATVPSQTATSAPTPATTTPATTTPSPTTPSPTKPAPTKPTAKPGPPTSFDGDGEYLVGEDIAAGTYKTAGPADFDCYWERDKDSSGDFESIIANDNLSGSGRVTVRKGEVFKTEGCQTWKKVS